jgi:succinate dehydrogenase / fumarate reductase, membrane anchor subunit
MAETRHLEIMRSPLGRARGLGSSHGGSHHWVTERMTAIALVPLTVWFIFSMVRLAGASHQAVIVWLASPLTMVLMLILIASTFHHLQLGLQSVLIDYVRSEWLRLPAVLAVKAICLLLALTCIISVLKIGFHISEGPM